MICGCFCLLLCWGVCFPRFVCVIKIYFDIGLFTGRFVCLFVCVALVLVCVCCFNVYGCNNVCTWFMYSCYYFGG